MARSSWSRHPPSGLISTPAGLHATLDASDATNLDLYSYGRALDRASTARAPDHLPTFLCVGCGASVAAGDAELVRHLGWRLLPRGRDGEPERPVLCPRCARPSPSPLPPDRRQRG